MSEKISIFFIIIQFKHNKTKLNSFVDCVDKYFHVVKGNKYSCDRFRAAEKTPMRIKLMALVIILIVKPQLASWHAHALRSSLCTSR